MGIYTELAKAGVEVKDGKVKVNDLDKAVKVLADVKSFVLDATGLYTEDDGNTAYHSGEVTIEAAGQSKTFSCDGLTDRGTHWLEEPMNFVAEVLGLDDALSDKVYQAVGHDYLVIEGDKATVFISPDGSVSVEKTEEHPENHTSTEDDDEEEDDND